MIRGIYHSAAGMLPRYVKLISISNNLANASTTSFKADRRYFSTVLNNELTQQGAPNQALRVKELDEGVYTDYGQGALERSGNKTDFALNGEGFFTVEDPYEDKSYYTRDGRFKINSQSELVTPQGHRVMDDSGAPIVINDSNFFVDESGTVFVDGRQTAKMNIVKFDALDNLKKIGDNLYTLKADVTPEIAEDTKVAQGMLENSNVNVVEEMVQMIALNRNYESSQRALKSQDQSLQKLINQVPKF